MSNGDRVQWSGWVVATVRWLRAALPVCMMLYGSMAAMPAHAQRAPADRGAAADRNFGDRAAGRANALDARAPERQRPAAFDRAGDGQAAAARSAGGGESSRAAATKDMVSEASDSGCRDCAPALQKRVRKSDRDCQWPRTPPPKFDAGTSWAATRCDRGPKP